MIQNEKLKWFLAIVASTALIISLFATITGHNGETTEIAFLFSSISAMLLGASVLSLRK